MTDAFAPSPRPAHRLIPSQIPPIGLFDTVATTADLAAVMIWSAGPTIGSSLTVSLGYRRPNGFMALLMPASGGIRRRPLSQSDQRPDRVSCRHLADIASQRTSAANSGHSGRFVFDPSGVKTLTSASGRPRSSNETARRFTQAGFREPSLLYLRRSDRRCREGARTRRLPS